MPAGIRTLFLQAPSFEGFDGGAGSRYQARREIRSFWYPTWLAQVAALTPNSTVVDAPPHGLKLSDVLARAGDFDVAMMAGRYSLLIQSGLAEFLPLALEKKMGVMLAGVFNSGILATGAVPGAHFEYAPAPLEIMDRVRLVSKIGVCDKRDITRIT